MVKKSMNHAMFHAFVDELEKFARRGVVELLASKATRKGLDPTKLPAISQVGNILHAGSRGRAAEVAKNVSGFLGKPPLSAAA
jgi:hypothetical protein